MEKRDMAEMPKFALVVENDDGKAAISFHHTEAERDDATLFVIWHGGRAVAPPSEADTCLNSLRENGVLAFDADAPVRWFTVSVVTGLQ